MASSLRPVLLFRQLPATSSPIVRSQLGSSPAFALHHALRRSPFHSTPARAILPPLPQVIKGTVNDPAPVHPPEATHGSYHWTAERLISAALVPMTIAPFAAGSLNPLMDGVLIGALIIHSHIGFQACITDYFPTWRVPGIRRLLAWTLNIATLLVGWGFYEFETNDVGLTEAVKRIWKA